MSPISITIDWVYFLGIIGFLITLAWLASGKFSKIETDVKWMKADVGGMKADIGWMKKLLYELKVRDDNKNTGAFVSKSPVSLTSRGKDILERSGMKMYVDSNQEVLSEYCGSEQDSNAYKIEQRVFINPPLKSLPKI